METSHALRNDQLIHKVLSSAFASTVVFYNNFFGSLPVKVGNFTSYSCPRRPIYFSIDLKNDSLMVIVSIIFIDVSLEALG